MENFIKSFLVSLLVSGSFVTHAMDDHDKLARGVAASLGMTFEDYLGSLKEAALLGISAEECRASLRAAQGIKKEAPSRILDSGDALEKAMAASLGITVEEYHEEQKAASLGLSVKEYRAALDAEKSRSQREARNTFIDTRSDWAIAYQMEQYDPFEKQQQMILDRAIAELLQAELNPIAGIITQDHVDRIISAVSQNPDILQEFSRNYKGISGHVQTIPNNHDVHILDDYVFGSQSQIVNLLGVGRHLAIDNGNLSWAEIQENLLKMLPKSDANWLSDYEGQKITAGLLRGHIATYFGNLPNEIAGFFGGGNARCDQVRELWSRTISLTATLDQYDPTIFPILAQCISENYLTKGGCIQGRINRIFLRYVALLGAAGINDTIEVVEALSK